MSDKGRPPVAAAGQDRSFLLLAGCNPAALAAGKLEPDLRRIGLCPEAREPVASLTNIFDGTMLAIRFGDHDALAGRAAAAVLQSVLPPQAYPDDGCALACVSVSETAKDRILHSRELFKMAVLLIDLTGAEQLYWSPAGLWSDARQFRAAVAEMLVSGMPPVLHLIDFRPDDATAALRSRGLAHFAGQELALRDGGGLDHKELVRRLARLAIDIMINGPVRAPREFPGMTASERIRVVPGAGDEAGTLFVSLIAA